MQRGTSFSVSSNVRRVGGKRSRASLLSSWAAGSPSVIMMICLLPPFCRPRSRESWKPWCMLVPMFHSVHASFGKSSALNSRVEREAEDVQAVARELAADQRGRASATFFAGRK